MEIKSDSKANFYAPLSHLKEIKNYKGKIKASPKHL